MKTDIEIWTVKDLFDSFKTINPQPKYQRGAVWKDVKKSLLIDSMLRGIDIPKIYLNKRSDGPFAYEVSDGQQRIDAIIKFMNDKLILRNDNFWGLDLNEIDSQKIGGLLYSELNNTLQSIFKKYKLTIAIIEDATPEEVRTLFGRLQLGETLKPAEKRNALISEVGMHIDNIAINHSFFTNSKIKEDRFNRQDYLAHVFALIAFDNSEDLKAALIEKLYTGKSKWPHKKIQIITDILNILEEIDGYSNKRIVNKFTFIDHFYFLYNQYDSYSAVDSKGYAEEYDLFEANRLSNYKDPEKLLAGKSNLYKKNLYAYIMNYRYEGARPTSISKRGSVIDTMFTEFLRK